MKKGRLCSFRRDWHGRTDHHHNTGNSPKNRFAR